MELGRLFDESCENIGGALAILSRRVLDRRRALHVVVGEYGGSSGPGEIRRIREELGGIGTVDLLAAVMRGSGDVAVNVAEPALVLALHEHRVVGGRVEISHEGVFVRVVRQRWTTPLGRAVPSRHL